MYDRLTKVDIEKMQAELDYRIDVRRPEILEDVKFARSHGDLSENAEYHAAKRERGKNESRIRYLKNMIKTAVIITDTSAEDEIGLFDSVTFTYDDGEEETVRIATTLRQNALCNIVSDRSPIGKALIGHKVGDTVYVKLNENEGYSITVKKIVKGEDDSTLDIRGY